MKTEKKQAIFFSGIIINIFIYFFFLFPSIVHADYSVTVNITGDGTVTIGTETITSGEVKTYSNNQQITITASPSDGEQVNSITEDHSDNTEPIPHTGTSFTTVGGNHDIIIVNIEFSGSSDTTPPDDSDSTPSDGSSITVNNCNSFSSTGSGGSSGSNSSDCTTATDTVCTSGGVDLKIDDLPVQVQQSTVPANVFFLLDDSNTIDYEITTSETDTIFGSFGYLYGDAEFTYIGTESNPDDNDNVGTNYLGSGNQNAYGRGHWAALWSGYNRIYYKPETTYTPWPATSGSGYLDNADLDTPLSHPTETDDSKLFEVDLDYPYLTVTDSSGSNVPIPISHYYVVTCDTSEVYLVIIKDTTPDIDDDEAFDREYYKVTTQLDVPEDVIENGDLTSVDPSTVTLLSQIESYRTDLEERQNFANWFSYYRKRQMLYVNAMATVLVENADDSLKIGFAGPGTLAQGSYAGTVGKVLQPCVASQTNLTTIMTNLYKWRAGTTANAGKIRVGLENVGYYFDEHNWGALNGAPNNEDTWLGSSPIDASCQMNFVIVFTDGSFEGGAPNDSKDYDGMDQDTLERQNPGSDWNTFTHNIVEDDGSVTYLTGVAPYLAKEGGNLADQAMKWYLKDLSPLDNDVSTSALDPANWQHLVTYSIVSGDYGSIDPEAVPISSTETAAFDPFDSTTYPWGPVGTPDGITNGNCSNCGEPYACSNWCWPTAGNNDGTSVTDLWHAAVNGRGKFQYEPDPDELANAIQEILDDIKGRAGASGSAVSVSGDELEAGEYIFQTKYTTYGWEGDIYVYNANDLSVKDLDTSDSDIDTIGSLLDDILAVDSNNDGIPDATNDDNRNIFTKDSSVTVPFKDNLSITGLTGDLINFLRGDKSKEARFVEDTATVFFRDRLTETNGTFTLGDIIHSSPYYHDGVIYVGANDGMLHAFRAKDPSDASTAKNFNGGNGKLGDEIFAYVPSMVHGNLSELGSTSYKGCKHKYFVDLTPYAAEITTSSGTAKYLVGGLGKGGKGYYGIDISNIDQDTSAASFDLTSRTVWEYPSPGADDMDMGYSFSRAWIVQSHLNETDSNSKDGDWIVIFGNGYGSQDGEAVLYILNPTDGSLIGNVGKIKTGAVGCNGLSTPAPVDSIKSDGIVDYVFAGDLQGNMWKFDLTSSNFSDWKVYYNSSTTYSDTSKKPLINVGKPITTMPDVTKHCGTGYPGSLVVFGTGKLLSVDDISTSGHAVYGIWDFGHDENDPTEFLGSFDPTTTTIAPPSNITSANITLNQLSVEAVDVDSDGEDDYRIIGRTTDPPNWNPDDDSMPTNSSTGEYYNLLKEDNSSLDKYNKNPYSDDSSKPAHAGWFFNLTDTNERVILDTRIRSGLAYIVTAALNNIAECSGFSGTSWVHALDVCTGAEPENAVWKTNNDSVLDENDVVQVYDDSGNPVGDPVYVSAIKKNLVVGITLISDKAILSVDEDSTPESGGGIEIEDTLFFEAGFLYWNHRD